MSTVKQFLSCLNCTLIQAKCKNIKKSYKIYKRREKPYSENKHIFAKIHLNIQMLEYKI